VQPALEHCYGFVYSPLDIIDNSFEIKKLKNYACVFYFSQIVDFQPHLVFD